MANKPISVRPPADLMPKLHAALVKDGYHPRGKGDILKEASARWLALSGNNDIQPTEASIQFIEGNRSAGYIPQAPDKPEWLDRFDQASHSTVLRIYQAIADGHVTIEDNLSSDNTTIIEITQQLISEGVFEK